MKVTGVMFNMLSPQDNGLCARASVTFDNCLVIHNICVLNGKDGLCIVYPNRGFKIDETGRKKYMDIAHPIDNSFSKIVEQEVLTAYNETIQ